MVCISTCLFGFAFLGAMVYTMMKSKDTVTLQRFEALLTEEQKTIYADIKKERVRIYLQGLFLGIVLSFFFFVMMKNSVKSMIQRVCLFLVVGMGTAYLYYSLYPKSKYILEYLTTPEQNAAWLEIYKEMKSRHYMGLLLGIIGYALVGKSICK